MLDSISIVNKLTGNKYKNRFVLLVCLLVVSAFVEMLGVGILVPVVDLISDSENLKNYPLLEKHFSDSENIVLLIVGFLVVVYAVKNIYLFLLAYYQSTLLMNIQHDIAKTLFNVVGNSSYLDLIQQSKADIINTMSGELNSLIGGYITPLMGLISELIVVFLMVSVLLWYNFDVAIVVLIFSVSVSIMIMFLLKRKIVVWGVERQSNSKSMIGVVDDFISGAKEIKVYQKVPYILNMHSLFVKGFVRANRNIAMSNAIPRFSLEMVGVISLLIVVFLVSDEESAENILPIIILYAAVAFRLMPGFNRIVTFSNQLKYNKPCIVKIDSLFSELRRWGRNGSNHQNKCQGYEIQINKLNFSYNGKKNVLKDISLNIKENEKIGIIGGSGSGKTTLINLILGLIEPTTGTVIVGDCNSSDVPVDTFSYVPQEVFISDATIKENVVFDNISSDTDTALIHKSLKDAGLEDFINSSEEGINVRLGDAGAKISGGQKQRIGIARSIFHDSKIVVFDEATSALDYKTEHEVVQSIYKTLKGRIVIMVAHRISTLKDCDKIILLNDGEIVASGTYEYMTKENKEVQQIIKHGII